MLEGRVQREGEGEVVHFVVMRLPSDADPTLKLGGVDKFTHPQPD